MPEDEFTTDLRWPADPLRERAEARHDPAGVPDDMQLRQLRTKVDDLSADVTRLLAAGSTSSGTANDASAATTAELESVIADLRDLLALMKPAELVRALQQLRDEVASLRKRIPLRANESGPLTGEQIDQLADALLERGVSPGDRPS